MKEPLKDFLSCLGVDCLQDMVLGSDHYRILYFQYLIDLGKPLSQSDISFLDGLLSDIPLELLMLSWRNAQEKKLYWGGGLTEIMCNQLRELDITHHEFIAQYADFIPYAQSLGFSVIDIPAPL